MYVFVQTSHDWADEFDYTGCFVALKARVEEYLARIKKAFEDGDLTEGDEFYFGTNEALQFDSYEWFMRGVTITECSKEFYEEFNSLTGGYGIGSSIISDMYDRIVDNEVDEEFLDEE